MVTISPVNAVAKPMPARMTIRPAQTSMGSGFLATVARLSSIAEIASLSRSSMSGTATTLIEKIKVAKPLPMTR